MGVQPRATRRSRPARPSRESGPAHPPARGAADGAILSGGRGTTDRGRPGAGAGGRWADSDSDAGQDSESEGGGGGGAEGREDTKVRERNGSMTRIDDSDR